MKILLVQDTDWVQRNPIQHNHLMERMVLRGHEVRVIDYEIAWREERKREVCSKRKAFSVSRIIPAAKHTVIRPRLVKIPFVDYFSMLFTYRNEINRQLGEFKPDVVIGDGVLTPNLAFRAAKKKRVKTLYYCIDIDYRLIPLKIIQPLGKQLESWNMRHADAVLSINKKLREYTIRMGAAPSRTEVISAGVDCGKFDPNLDKMEIRQKYGFAANDKVLFFVGWLYHFSGLKEVAAQLAKLNRPDIKMLIVGDGDAYSDLLKLKDALKLGGRLVLAGKQPYEIIQKYIAAADICLLPAYNNEIMRDIVPIKLYDYMAMGKPVITTKLPGIMAEFGQDNGIVYIDKPEDVIAKAIELLQNGSDKLIGAQARRFAQQNSWDIKTAEFEKYLREMLKK